MNENYEKRKKKELSRKKLIETQTETNTYDDLTGQTSWPLVQENLVGERYGGEAF